jgi:hypothetical protein
MPANAFDRSMVLLNKIIQVWATSYLDVLPFWMLPPQKSKGQVALSVAIERDPVRPPRQCRRKGFAEES